jgi:hypothetical protein
VIGIARARGGDDSDDGDGSDDGGDGDGDSADGDGADRDGADRDGADDGDGGDGEDGDDRDDRDGDGGHGAGGRGAAVSISISLELGPTPCREGTTYLPVTATASDSSPPCSASDTAPARIDRRCTDPG